MADPQQTTSALAMAEAAAPSASWSAHVQCRYFLHGMCQRAENCPYSHNLGTKPSTVCRYYLQGKCSYGKSCRYDHIKPKAPQTTPIASKSSTTQPHKNLSKLNSTATTSAIPKPMVLSSWNGECERRMVTLKKQGSNSTQEQLPLSPGLRNTKPPEEWVKAAEFVPGQMWKSSEPASYLEAAQTGVESVTAAHDEEATGREEVVDPHPHMTDEEKAKELCPFALHGECRYGENCLYMHGDFCDYCGRAALHPTDQELRSQHTSECIKQHEKDMELSFAIARSSDKACGICMEVVMEKTNTSEQRFGLLSNCNHVFCLSCIRKWRAAKQFENKIVRSCPECRVKSDFVTPSKYWVEERADKEMLIEGYKEALRMKPCKYFDQGRGECPFNNNCFYLHAYPDGRKASPRPVRRHPRQNADGELDFVQQIILWDFLEEHRRRLTLEFDLEDSLEELLMSAGLWDSSSEDSDYSENS